jgi:hypothetical protein
MARAPQTQSKTASGVRNVAVSLAALLDVGELLTGTPTVAEVTTSALTITNAVVSTTELTINGVAVPIGEAVQFQVAGGVANTLYKIKITVLTDSTPAQTLVVSVRLNVTADA